MSAVWRYLDDGGKSCGSSPRFEERSRAEAWLAENWPKLVESGIAEVELVEDEQVRYRMALGEE